MLMICLRFGNDDTWFLVMRFGRASEVLGVCFGNNYKTDWVWSLVESSSYFVLCQVSLSTSSP
jgi:hypothetical protein